MFFGSGLIRLWCLKVGPLGSNWVGLRWDGRAPQSSHDDAIKEGVEGGHTSGSVCLLAHHVVFLPHGQPPAGATFVGLPSLEL